MDLQNYVEELQRENQDQILSVQESQADKTIGRMETCMKQHSAEIQAQVIDISNAQHPIQLEKIHDQAKTIEDQRAEIARLREKVPRN